MPHKESIRKLVDFALLDKTNITKIISIGVIDENQAEIISAKTGLNYIGYERVIDKSAIKHIIKKHGNAKTEALRGQLAITAYDFELIPKIVMSPNVIFSGKNKIGRDCLLYEATIVDVYYYVEEVRTGKRQLAMNTLYKRKQKNR